MRVLDAAKPSVEALPSTVATARSVPRAAASAAVTTGSGASPRRPVGTVNGALAGSAEKPGGSSSASVPDAPRTLRTVTSSGRGEASGKSRSPLAASTVTAGRTSSRR